jgi:cytochrome c peroxidase
MKRLVFLAAAIACEQPFTLPEPPDPRPATLDAQLRQTLQGWFIIPIGPMPAQNPALVELGQALMFDKILSGNRDVSCATCHHPAATAGDGLSLAIGTGGAGAVPNRTLGAGRVFAPRNGPTLLNVGLGLNYIFWDGRVSNLGGPGPGGPIGPPGPGSGNGRFLSPAGADLPADITDILAAQAMFPVVNRQEMRGLPGDLDRFGNPNELAQYGDSEFVAIWQAVMRRLLAIPEYVTKFSAAFPGVPTSALGFQHAAAAIAAFQKQAFTKTGSPFDRYLARDDAALTTEQKRGALLFFGAAGCSGCHNGPFLGGNNFANVGVPQLGPGTGAGTPLDFGFGETIDQPFYRFAFRVAPLRNVELTAPYMHNGAYATLEAVVRHYNDIPTAQAAYDAGQLAPELRATHHGDAATIAAVLETLDGRVPPRQSLSATEMSELVAFLTALTDPAARDLSALVPTRVPSGLPIPD